MSLDAYRHARLIVQNARTSVVDAARAMRTNEIGCVVVTERQRIVGIVTDRDLALRVVGEARDPESTCLGEVMSSNVAALEPDASAADALRLMREHSVRRLPLVERHRVVGMVTLDDLLLAQAAPMPDAAAVVRAQLVEGGPARTRRFDEWQALQRRHARGYATVRRLLLETERSAKLKSLDRAEVALSIVLLAIVRRLPRSQAARVIAQLPAMFRGRFDELPRDREPDVSITRESIEAEIAGQLEVPRSRAASIVDGVGRALARNARLVHNLRRYLPQGMRTIFPEVTTVASRPSSRRPANESAGLSSPPR